MTKIQAELEKLNLSKTGLAVSTAQAYAFKVISILMIAILVFLSFMVYSAAPSEGWLMKMITQGSVSHELDQVEHFFHILAGLLFLTTLPFFIIWSFANKVILKNKQLSSILKASTPESAG